jgi:hypothetical protein
VTFLRLPDASTAHSIPCRVLHTPPTISPISCSRLTSPSRCVRALDQAGKTKTEKSTKQLHHQHHKNDLHALPAASRSTACAHAWSRDNDPEILLPTGLCSQPPVAAGRRGILIQFFCVSYSALCTLYSRPSHVRLSKRGMEYLLKIILILVGQHRSHTAHKHQHGALHSSKNQTDNAYAAVLRSTFHFHLSPSKQPHSSLSLRPRSFPSS